MKIEKEKFALQQKQKKQKNYLFARSLFMSRRRFYIDLLLCKFAQFFPKFFSLFLLLLFFPNLSLLKRILGSFNFKDIGINRPDSKITIIYEQVHSRKDAHLSFFSKRIDRTVLCEKSQKEEPKGTVVAELIKKDWISIWLYLLKNYEEKRLFVIFSMSDLSVMPLKWHPMKNVIYFDAYDPLYFYLKNESVKKKCIENYGIRDVNYLIRDPRFSNQLRLARNRSAKKIYLPDDSSIKHLPRSQVSDEIHGNNVIRFVSSGWITAYGDEGILRSIELIRKVWINSEFHICFTKFMSLNDPKLIPLIEYLNSNSKCYIHTNLTTDEYVKILDSCDVGLSLHDVNVFGESYDILTEQFVSLCPSSRVLDYAVRGLILMTTPQHRFQRRIFSASSPHKMFIYFDKNTTKCELSELVIRKRKDQNYTIV